MIRLGEPVFRTVQGELPAGKLIIFVRFFGCTLTCQGFSQKDPSDPTTWVSPLKIEPKEYQSLNDLPILKVGCDSMYSINPKFKHLALSFKDAKELFDSQIQPLLYDGKWTHEVTGNSIDLSFTGGEPMLWQKAIMEIYQQTNKGPNQIQIETNATKRLTTEFKNWYRSLDINLLWNISPKLFYVSGEISEKAWHPEIIKEYWELTNWQGQPGNLKFVITDDERAWNELDSKVKELRSIGVGFPIYIMPCAASYEQISDVNYLRPIAEKALEKGYHIAYRSHIPLFGNGIGT